MKSKNTLIIIILYSILAVSAPIFAQTNNSVTVQPSKIDLTANPGDKVRNSLFVANGTTLPMTFKISVKNFRQKDEDGNINFYPAEGQESAENWIIPQYNIISVAPLSSTKMDYIVYPKNDMSAKGYAGAIIFQMYDTVTKTASGKTFGTLVSLNVMGNGITTGGEISNFKTSFFQYKDPLKFSVKIKNPSNSNLYASGTIAFNNIFGKQVARFDTGKMEVYPKTSKFFSFAWKDAPLFGIYKSEISLTNNMRQDHKMSASSWVLVLPWGMSLVYTMLTIIFITLLVTAYKYKNVIVNYGRKSFTFKLNNRWQWTKKPSK